MIRAACSLSRTAWGRAPACLAHLRLAKPEPALLRPLCAATPTYRPAGHARSGNPPPRPFAPTPLTHRGQQHARRMATSAASAGLELEVVEVDNPNGLNFILGHSHFIKTVEDLYEALVQSGVALKFGIAFNEASGDPNNTDMPGRKVRFDGNDEDLITLAKQNAMKLGAGHTFIIFLDKGFPVSVLNAIKQVPEVCRIHCATANPCAVIVAKLGEERKGILGVIDGVCPVDYETPSDKDKRHSFLRMIGYKR